MSEKIKPPTLLKVEFHEGKNRRLYCKNYIDTYFFFDDVRQFVKWATQKEKNYKHYEVNSSIMSTFDYKIERLKKSRAKRPKFEMSINGSHVRVFPRENLIINRQLGIHYICQHSFNAFPQYAKRVFYNHINPEDIGLLYPIEGEPLMVNGKDIVVGFHQHREENQKYSDSFVEFIRARRAKDEKKKSAA